MWNFGTKSTHSEINTKSESDRAAHSFVLLYLTDKALVWILKNNEESTFGPFCHANPGFHHSSPIRAQLINGDLCGTQNFRVVSLSTELAPDEILGSGFMLFGPSWVAGT